MSEVRQTSARNVSSSKVLKMAKSNVWVVGVTVTSNTHYEDGHFLPKPTNFELGELSRIRHSCAVQKHPNSNDSWPTMYSGNYALGVYAGFI